LKRSGEERKGKKGERERKKRTKKAKGKQQLERFRDITL